ncbi:MAG TPA: hypothetical protein VGP33_14980 [Chloroflexota bacterium]|jgi:hypothetical protein|nr:hypothetical protein [Chloroflexota bacterium]
MRDASAFLGAWPFAGCAPFSLADLIAEYQACGIDAAALSPLEAVLQPEPMAANRRLLTTIQASADGAFHAWAAPILNPSLPGWEEHLAICRQVGGASVRAIKLVPSYHDYALDHPEVTQLAHACLQQGLGLCLQVRMEDERMQHARMHVPRVEPAAVAALAERCPTVPILVCGSYLAELAAYSALPSVCAELSFVESGMLLTDALGRLGAERLLVGTHSPIHMIAPNAAKLTSEILDDRTAARLGVANFDRFFNTRL